MENDKYMNVAECAKYIKKSEHTLNNWRSNKEVDLPFFRIGRSILYSRNKVDKWLQEKISEQQH